MALSSDQIEYLHLHSPGAAVAYALSELLVNDHDLLSIDANERSITFRFAMYLQRCLPDWTVDCEYNRDGVDPKKLAYLGLDPDSEDDEAKTVFPDVIVHRRGRRENFLVLEFKKSTSHVDRNIDLQKLQGYKRQLGYEHALYVEVGTAGQAMITMLRWV
ncbi:hypothetical protein [Burkholderia sp. BCC1988]|uniref:hypothetical protein n=1 Tax=Burkholderia sp. BCC1988 TaxID=2817443 RepID=UPI002AAF0E58|nr:hypothetical protein [Burkholderia sp. BCC1988]